MQRITTSTPSRSDGIPRGPGHVARTTDADTDVVVDTALVILNHCHTCGTTTPIGIPTRGTETADEWWEQLQRLGVHAAEQVEQHMDECSAVNRPHNLKAA